MAFYLSVHDPLFDGTNLRIRDRQAYHGIGVVEFKRMTSVKIGFMLTFHDETLECAANWTVTRTAPGATMPEVPARLSAEAL